MQRAAVARFGRAGCVGRVYAFCKCRLIPPHQSLSRQLPPKGKPFCKSPFALHNRADRKSKPQHKMIFAMFAQCKEDFPLGERKLQAVCRVKRLMRGDQSPPRNVYSPLLPHPQKEREAAPSENHLPPEITKLPPRAPAPNKANPISALYGRVLLGEVLGERGRFGGREPPLRKRGLSPSKVFPLPCVKSS